VAFLNSYDSRWAIDFQRHHKDYDYVWHLREHYAPFFRRNITVDLVSALEGPSQDCRLAVAPALWVLRDDTAERLKDFVAGGGHLVITTRTGAKDWENAMRPTLPPGPLAPLAGLEIEDTYPLLEPIEVAGKGLKGRCKIWGERVRIRARDAEVRAVFGKGCGWLEGRPAVVSRPSGRGRVTYLAGWFDERLLDCVMAQVMREAGVKQRFAGPAGVEFAVRSGGRGNEILMILNHTDRPASITGVTGTNLLKGGSVHGRWILRPRDVAVVRLR
jgi:beta-galactosidase